jgi:hypothetical protein
MKSDDKRYGILQVWRKAIPSVQELSIQETKDFRAAWRKHFIGPDAKGAGIPLHKCHACGSGRQFFDWHYFSYNVYIASTNYIEKITQSSNLDERVVVFPDKCDINALILRLGDLIEYLKVNPEVGSDIYITPKKMGWTLVFTHEDDFGPYFVKSF